MQRILLIKVSDKIKCVKIVTVNVEKSWKFHKKSWTFPKKSWTFPKKSWTSTQKKLDIKNIKQIIWKYYFA